MINSIKKRILILLNITNSCNMACSYCYYRQEMDCNPGNMNIDTLEIVIQRAAESSFDEIKFIFHGGEPLIRNIDFFKQAISLQKKYLNNKKYINSIQTNGTLLTDDLIDMFIEHKFEIGISLDGPDVAHNYYRKFKDGKGTFKCIEDNINKLQQKGVNIGILSVCSDKTLENINEYYDLIKGFKNIKGFDLIAPELNGAKPILTKGNFSRLLITLFEKWFYDNSCQFNIRFLDAIIIGFIFSKPSVCYFMKNCLIQNQMVSISPQGNVCPCDNNTSINLGSIFEYSLENMLHENPVRKLYGRKENDRVEKCIFCKWYNLCRGGCPSHYDKEKGNIYCEDFKKIFSYIDNVLNDMNIYDKNILTKRKIDSIPNTILRKRIKEIYQNVYNEKIV